MEFLSHRVERSDLEAGDHIYSWRTGFFYAHHGIYVGENHVIHFTHNIASSSSGPSFSSSVGLSTEEAPVTCSHIRDAYDGISFDGSGVIISCLDCFLKTGSLYRYQYGVGAVQHILKLRGGTCTTAEADPPETVIHRAKYLLHNGGFFEYNLVTNNCEDFALYCKTGRLAFKMKEKGPAPAGSSGQVRSRKSPGPFFCRKRYQKDIGVRDDAIKVEAENIKASCLKKLGCF